MLDAIADWSGAPPPPPTNQPPDESLVTITASLTGPHGTHASRTAVIQIAVIAGQAPFRILKWS